MELRWIVTRWWSLKRRAKGQEHATLAELIMLFLITQHATCPHTGVKLGYHNCDLDHKVAIANGGAHTIENLEWVERKYNRRKKGKFNIFEEAAWLSEDAHRKKKSTTRPTGNVEVPNEESYLQEAV